MDHTSSSTVCGYMKYCLAARQRSKNRPLSPSWFFFFKPWEWWSSSLVDAWGGNIQGQRGGGLSLGCTQKHCFITWTVCLWVCMHTVGCVFDWGCKQKQNLFGNRVLNNELCITCAFEVKILPFIWLSQLMSQNERSLFYILCWWSFSVVVVSDWAVKTKASHINIDLL